MPSSSTTTPEASTTSIITTCHNSSSGAFKAPPPLPLCLHLIIASRQRARMYATHSPSSIIRLAISCQTTCLPRKKNIFTFRAVHGKGLLLELLRRESSPPPITQILILARLLSPIHQLPPRHGVVQRCAYFQGHIELSGLCDNRFYLCASSFQLQVPFKFNGADCCCRHH